MIRILIAEDLALVRGAIANLLDLEDNIEVVAQAENGEHAISLLHQHQSEIDIVLTDIEMPLKSGLELAPSTSKANSLLL